MSIEWEPIDAFDSLSEYKRFVCYVDACVADGFAEEIAADPDYSRGEIYGGRWFKEMKSGICWRLVEPDFPFRGLWERVTVPGSLPDRP